MIVSEQTRNFCLFLIIGLFIGFIFDIFRGFRKNFKLPNILVDLQDIIYLTLVGLLYFRSILIFNTGNLRFYIVFSSISGITIYFLTLSGSCVIIIDVIFKLIKSFCKATLKLLKILYYFVKRVLKSKTKSRSDNIEKYF